MKGQCVSLLHLDTAVTSWHPIKLDPRRTEGNEGLLGRAKSRSVCLALATVSCEALHDLPPREQAWLLYNVIEVCSDTCAVEGRSERGRS